MLPSSKWNRGKSGPKIYYEAKHTSCRAQFLDLDIIVSNLDNNYLLIEASENSKSISSVKL